MPSTEKSRMLDLLQRLVEGQLRGIEGKMEDEDMLSLALSCENSMIIAALDLLDYEEVAKLKMPNGRIIHQVSSSTGMPHIVSTTGHPWHCPCIAFSLTVANQTHVLCKHILACLLAERLNMFQERDVTYDYIATISS